MTSADWYSQGVMLGSQLTIKDYEMTKTVSDPIVYAHTTYLQELQDQKANEMAADAFREIANKNESVHRESQDGATANPGMVQAMIDRAMHISEIMVG